MSRKRCASEPKARGRRNGGTTSAAGGVVRQRHIVGAHKSPGAEPRALGSALGRGRAGGGRMARASGFETPPTCAPAASRAHARSQAAGAHPLVATFPSHKCPPRCHAAHGVPQGAALSVCLRQHGARVTPSPAGRRGAHRLHVTQHEDGLMRSEGRRAWVSAVQRRLGWRASPALGKMCEARRLPAAVPCWPSRPQRSLTQNKRRCAARGHWSGPTVMPCTALRGDRENQAARCRPERVPGECHCGCVCGARAYLSRGSRPGAAMARVGEQRG